jgi:GGDEF domain-containing protein
MAICPDDVGNASDLIRLADAGMYQMKQRARNSVPEALNAS